jgi:hypothetical protein
MDYFHKIRKSQLLSISSQTPEEKNTPAGYDVKALEYSKDNNIDVQEKLKMGFFHKDSII